MIPQEHSCTHIHALLYARARVKCGGGSDEESILLVGIHLVVTRVVVVVVVVVGVSAIRGRKSGDWSGEDMAWSRVVQLLTERSAAVMVVAWELRRESLIQSREWKFRIREISNTDARASRALIA